MDEYDVDDDPDEWCPECGQENDTTGRLCSECQKDDCLNCGTCDECIDLTMANQEAWEKDHRPVFTKCQVCDRGLNAEDLEMNNGMCIPCSEE